MLGVRETEPNIRNKLAKGKFTAAIVIECLFRDWMPHTEAGRVIPALAFLALAGGYGLASCDLSRVIERQDKAHGVQRDTELWAPIPFDHGPVSKPYTARCDQPKDREEADLCQQWRAANAAESTASSQWLWNLIQYVLTLAAIWFAAQAAREASRATGVSTAALDESRKANEATLVEARRSADAAIRAADVERGFIFVKPRISWARRATPTGFHPHVGFVLCTMKNYGRSPVIVRQVELEIQTLSKPLEPDNTLPMAVISFPGGEVMEPSDERIFPDRQTQLFYADGLAALKSGSAFVWYYGCVTYEDVFGTVRYTRFRWMDNRLANSFAPNGDKPFNERT